MERADEIADPSARKWWVMRAARPLRAGRLAGLRSRRRRLRLGSPLLAVALLVGLSVLAPAPAGAATQPGTFTPLRAARLLDTRSGVGAPAAAVAPWRAVQLQVTGRGGVPASGVSAVVLNVTVTQPAKSGVVTAYADGAARPTASNLNFVPGQTVPNLVVVPVGANGKVDLYNGSGGTVQLVADVEGYYLAGTVSAPGAFRSLAPQRLLDTRSGLGAPARAVAAGGTVRLQVAGRGGVPASGASSVVLNVTVTQPTDSGFITAYADGASRPSTSNVNFVRGQTVPNLVVVPVGADGQVALHNTSAGTVHVVADVAGYHLAGTPSADGAFRTLAPARLLDTRSGVGAPAAAVAPWRAVQLQVTGRGGVPASGVSAVVLNVTVTQPAKSGVVTAYADGAARPTASNLNFVPGQTVPNLVVVPVGANGKVDLYNGSGGTVQLVADVFGYDLGSAATPTPAPTGTVCTNPYFTTSDPNGGITDGGYYVHNNLWNASSYPGTKGTTQVCSFHSWNHVGTAGNTSRDGAVKTYPNVHKDYSGRTIGSFPRLTARYAATPPNVGIYNVAFDLWLNGVPNDEVMIWTDNHNQVPAGSRFASGVVLGGRSWDVYATSGNGYIAFVPSGGARYPSGTVDLKAMLGYLVSAKRVAGSSTVDQICYGVEIVDTGGSPATWKFTDFAITDS